MNVDLSTSSSIVSDVGIQQRAVHWVLYTGNRVLVASGLVLAVFVGFLGLVSFDIVAVGPNSSAATAFGSGLISGTLTVVTVALSINQLILSRVFGSPNEFQDRLDGTRDLRRMVQRHAGVSSTPNDPAAFLSLIARALAARSRQLESALGRAPQPGAEAFAAGIASYGESIDENVAENTPIVNALDVILGTGYAKNMTATEHFRNEYAEDLPAEALEELDVIEDLLDAIAIARQFFKTISLQQDFARLSRMLAYSGFVALLTSLVLALSYRTNAVTFDLQYLPLIIPLGVAIIATPLAIFISYILRSATIARHTVSVGPFVPPEDQTTSE